MRSFKLATVCLMLAGPAALAEGALQPFDIPIEALPEVVVQLPADRTEFSIPLAPAIAPPVFDGPARAGASGQGFDVIVALPPEVDVVIPEAPIAAFAAAPAPVEPTPLALTLEALPTTGDPQLAIASMPDRSPTTLALPAAPVVSAPLATPPVVVIAPPAVAPWSERLDKAMVRVTAAAPHLPPSVLQSLRAYYTEREDRLFFTGKGAVSAPGDVTLDVASRAEEHGLDPRRFEALAALGRQGAPEEAELALAALAVSYARDARGARLNPAAVSRLITATPTIPDVAEVLDGLSAAPDVTASLEGWNPQHAGYRALRQQLAQMRSSDHTASTGKPGRSGMEGDIIANLERWRWLPVELGTNHIMVNVPAYRLELKRGERTVFETRVVVGKPQTPTPIFSHQLEYLVVNPYWNVPPSIALKEYLPLLKTNPYALQARGLEVVQRGRIVDPASIDWSRMPRAVSIRQPPGERNALGFIKFMFPNDHAVYLHDTPSRGLFSASRRAFSHGCVRVQNPFALAAAVSGLGEGRLRSMVGGAERRLDLDGETGVHLAYFTLDVSDQGTLIPREDIYGFHRRMKRVMGL